MVWVLVRARDWLFATRVISVSAPFECAVVGAPDMGKATCWIIGNGGWDSVSFANACSMVAHGGLATFGGPFLLGRDGAWATLNHDLRGKIKIRQPHEPSYTLDMDRAVWCLCYSVQVSKLLDQMCF